MNMQDINHCEIKLRIQSFDFDAYEWLGTSMDIQEHGVWVKQEEKACSMQTLWQRDVWLATSECHLGGVGSDVNMVASTVRDVASQTFPFPQCSQSSSCCWLLPESG
ncbi:unnamed protein product, partial [Brassica rapa]